MREHDTPSRRPMSAAADAKVGRRGNPAPEGGHDQGSACAVGSGRVNGRFVPALALAGYLAGMAAALMWPGRGGLSASGLALATLCLIWLVRSLPAAPGRIVLLCYLWLPAVAVRAAFVQLHGADSDLCRVIWEGLVQSAGFNPYLAAPADPALARLAAAPDLAGLYAGINHKNLAAAYPPLAQLAARTLAAVSTDPRLFKAALAACDLGAAVFLARTLARRNLPPGHLGLFLLQPLVILAGAGEGHLDALQALFTAAGLYFFQSGRDGRGFLSLGLAAMSKLTAAVLLPFFLTRANARRLPLAILPLAAYLAFPWSGPMADSGSGLGLGGLLGSLPAFAAHIHHNAPAAGLLWPLLGPLSPYGAAALGALGLAVIWLTVPERPKSAFYALAWATLCLPSLYPWYLVTPALFLPLFPAPAWLWLTGAAFPVHLLSGGPPAPAWAGLVQFGPLAALASWRPLFGGRIRSGGPYGPPGRLDVIIPTRNEAGDIAACLQAIGLAAEAGHVGEVIVSDGGSTDGTVGLAASRGAVVVSGPPGRGRQIARGIEAARGGTLLVVHADCRLDPDAPARIIEALHRDRSLAGGSLTLRYDAGGGPLCWAALLNDWRARFCGLSFGDQGQFFRREALSAMGGFPEMALMEDVEAAFRLKAAGRTAALGAGIAASARRWRERGPWRNFSSTARLFFRYLIERRLDLADPSGERYRRVYYGSGEAHQVLSNPTGARSQPRP